MGLNEEVSRERERRLEVEQRSLLHLHLLLHLGHLADTFVQSDKAILSGIQHG